MIKQVTFAAILILLITACSNDNNREYIPDANIDMSDDLLLSDESVLTEMPEYTKVRSGESKTIQRSFENAPPLIPHRVNGFFPIKADDNKCLRCHMPDKAPKFDATPLPETHFTSYRPNLIEKNGIYYFPNKFIKEHLLPTTPISKDCKIFSNFKSFISERLLVFLTKTLICSPFSANNLTT